MILKSFTFEMISGVSRRFQKYLNGPRLAMEAFASPLSFAVCPKAMATSEVRANHKGILRGFEKTVWCNRPWAIVRSVKKPGIANIKEPLYRTVQNSPRTCSNKLQIWAMQTSEGIGKALRASGVSEKTRRTKYWITCIFEEHCTALGRLRASGNYGKTCFSMDWGTLISLQGLTQLRRLSIYPKSSHWFSNCFPMVSS